MIMRTTLLTGIAGLAIAGAISFGAFAQTDPAAPTTEPQATNPGQTPATAPSVARVKQHHHRGVFRGQSGPQDSTPEEAAATERLNQQQLQQPVQPATPATPTSTP